MTLLEFVRGPLDGIKKQVGEQTGEITWPAGFTHQDGRSLQYIYGRMGSVKGGEYQGERMVFQGEEWR